DPAGGIIAGDPHDSIASPGVYAPVRRAKLRIAESPPRNARCYRPSASKTNTRINGRDPRAEKGSRLPLELARSRGRAPGQHDHARQSCPVSTRDLNGAESAPRGRGESQVILVRART